MFAIIDGFWLRFLYSVNVGDVCALGHEKIALRISLCFWCELIISILDVFMENERVAIFCQNLRNMELMADHALSGFSLALSLLNLLLMRP